MAMNEEVWVTAYVRGRDGRTRRIKQENVGPLVHYFEKEQDRMIKAAKKTR